MRPLILLTCLLVLVACQAKDSEPIRTSQGAGTDEIQALQRQVQGQTEVLKDISRELSGIRERLGENQNNPEKRKPRAERVRRVSIDDDYMKGRPDAPITLIEFSDFQCPYCQRFFQETLPKLDKEFIQTGKLRFVYRDFPIEGSHVDAFRAAEAANCAGDQGQYWQMHDSLFENQEDLKRPDLKTYAQDLGLDISQFERCLDDQKFVDEVSRDFLDGQRAGVNGTPAFFLGVTGEDQTIEAIAITGARPFAYFSRLITTLLKEIQD